MVEPSSRLQIKLMLNSLEHQAGKIISDEDVNTHAYDETPNVDIIMWSSYGGACVINVILFQ